MLRFFCSKKAASNRMIRGTVQTVLRDHKVYITDWRNSRNVPLLHGRFDLADFVDLVIHFIRLLGPNIHVMAVCQPSVPVRLPPSLTQPQATTLVSRRQWF